MLIENAGNIVGHLRTQFERAHPVLFTGAGFSADAKSISKAPVPLVGALRQKLWEICFPGDAFEENSSLQDLYQTARTRHPQKLTETMTKNFTVDPNSLPDWYQLVFSLPWRRIYTLDVDDLASAVMRRFQLPRKLVPISAVTTVPNQLQSRDPSNTLEIIHLNGTLDDVPHNVTFSATQYAERLARDEPWYTLLVQDLIGRPVVFIGTSVDEPPIWQYVEKRRTRGGKSEQELRPKSYLITPSLSKAKQAFLSEYNILWVPANCGVFVDEVLKNVTASAAEGFDFLRTEHARSAAAGVIHEVAQLTTGADTLTEFLAGAEPVWADIQYKRAIERDSDKAIFAAAELALTNRTGARGILILTGTAGNGKSAALKRVALRIAASGLRIAWIDRETEASPKEIKDLMLADKGPAALAIDDADVYGSELSSLIREIALHDSHPLVIIAARSGRLDRGLNPVILEHVPQKEIVVPGLTDNDIEALLQTLDQHHMLGELAGKTAKERIQILREKCGRQLIVAMIEATSGRPFEEKIATELDQLDGEAHKLYAFVAVASALRFSLTKDELLTAIGDVTNVVMNALQRLTARHLLSCSKTQYGLRHRVIADVVFERLSQNGQLAEVLEGLAFSAAVHITSDSRTSSQPRRLLQRILNHDFLRKNVGTEEAKNLYGELEELLSRDFNFWLHRGSLELELGNLGLAERYLITARSLNDRDLNTQSEFGYLLFRKALSNPNAVAAGEFVDEAIKMLQENIALRGAKDPHSYHILGSNILQWVRTGMPSLIEQKAFILSMLRLVRDGRQKHPRNEHLRNLEKELESEQLGFALPRGSGS